MSRRTPHIPRKTHKPPETPNPQPHRIRRQYIYVGLGIAAIVAVYLTQCLRDNSNDPTEALYYHDTDSCVADLTNQQAQYAIAQQQYQAGQIEDAPTPPPLAPADCAAQMQAAQQEYQRTAPIYAAIADCQAEGLQCEPTPATETTTGYRPVFGGTYLDPDDSNYIFVNYAGSQHRVYAPRPVYRSTTTGIIVTPYGRQIPQTAYGRVTVPLNTTFAAPARPTGRTATGTIRGRSSQGFGSSFRGSGGGGK